MELSSQTKRASSRLAAARQSENQIKDMLLRSISWERLHIPIRKTPKQKNDVLYNVLISGLRDKHLVNRLMAGNSQANRPRFLDSAKRLLALSTN